MHTLDELIRVTLRSDGVTVAKSIVLENKFENLGARYVLAFRIHPIKFKR